ncbi:hypothetical protein P5E66_15535, partial [Clostridium perfringens]|nr:hypothetical protein [Clostridium perfringens]
SFLIKDNRLRLKEAVQEWLVKDASEGNLNAFKGRENWLKMDFESLFDAPKMIPMPGPHKEYHR